MEECTFIAAAFPVLFEKGHIGGSHLGMSLGVRSMHSKNTMERLQQVDGQRS